MSNTEAAHHLNRKQEHLSICISEHVESPCVRTGLEMFRFVHEALPEVNLEDVDTRCSLFGHELHYPFVISSMTGGIPEAKTINQLLAEAAQALGIAIGVGSQRVALLHPDAAASFQIRRYAPEAFIFANLGAIQLNNGFTIDECRRAVDMIRADALILHLNPLQEAVQSGGNTNFSGLCGRIHDVCSQLEVPVLVKEVGEGISDRTARMLREAGVAGIDTAGSGGTSWALVESLREHNGRSALGSAFSQWGIPTADSIQLTRQSAPDLCVIASGGLRSGLDAAKAIALGADFAGYGLPLLRAASAGLDSVIRLINTYAEELRIAMFCIGAQNMDSLKRTNSLVQISQNCGQAYGVQR